MWQLIGALAELERSLLVERTRTGVRNARRRGVKFGRKPKITPERIRDLRKLIAEGHTLTEAAQTMGWSRSTMYRALSRLSAT
jgi:DNA invertase Pin-like site-specific DNA recombinase